MRLAILLLCFAALASAANCNPNDQSGCPASCPAGAGSTTPAVIANTAWAATGVASISCLNGIQYGTNAADLVDEYYVTGANASTTLAVLCWMNGGWNSGTRYNCTGAGTSANVGDIIIKVQAAAASPNTVGGKGIAIYVFGYVLSTTTPWPRQWQDGKCAAWWFLANGGATPYIGNTSQVGIFAWSAGGTIGWWVANTPNNYQTASCSSSPATPVNGYIAAILSPPMSLAYPVGDGMYDGYDAVNCIGSQGNPTCNTIHAGIVAINNLFNCSDLASCRTGDSGVSPTALIVQANAANFTNNKFLILMGGNDNLVMPGLCTTCQVGFGTGGGGNMLSPMTQYAALTNPPYVITWVLSGGGHGADIGCSGSGCSVPPYGLASTAWQRAIRFLLGDQGTSKAAAGGVL